MRKVISAAAIALGFMGIFTLASKRNVPPPSEPLASAEIKISPAQPLGKISPYIFGASVEWTENGNRIFDPARGELRPEIMSGLKPLKIPVWRFPGGILSDYYHWQDGMGPRSNRPKRSNPMDRSVHENNFGTDEFVDFSKTLDSDPLITANFGTGSLNETLEWQKEFIKKGLPVKFWEMGNEIYLAEPRQHATIPGNDSRIYKTADTYATGFKQWAQALRAADRDVKVGVIAGTYNTSKENRGWLKTLLEKAAPDIDFIALHNAFAPLIFGKYDFNDEDKRSQAYQAMFAQAMFSAEDTRRVEHDASSAGVQDPKIAITEHFPLFGGGGTQKQVLAILDQSRTVASALYTASLFHAFMREHVWMANYNIAVSKWFGALLTDADNGIIRTPTYHVFDLYRNHFGDSLVSVSTSGPVFSTKQTGTVAPRSDVPYLDTIASTDSAGHIYLAVINRSLHQQVHATISSQGLPPDSMADVLTLAGPEPNAINGPSLGSSTRSGAPDTISPKSSSWSGVNSATYSFPPASITILKWKETAPKRR
jgi:alpha-N-arabinofuranosidase